MSDAAAPVPFFKKKSKASSSKATSSGDSLASTSAAAAPPATKARKRSLSPEDGSRSNGGSAPSAGRTAASAAKEEEESSVIRGKKRRAYNPLKQGTAGITKRLKQEEEAESDYDESDDGGASAIGVRYGDRRGGQGTGTGSGYAHRAGQEDDDLEETTLAGDAALAKSGEPQEISTDGLYHGASKYQAQLPTGSSKYAPIKGPNANLKTITLVDYQPDVCKDYKETGWCGFGDSCKFLHDRGDYLHGWQMDSILSLPSSAPVIAEAVEEELPFACIICRQPFGAPPHDAVVTRCGHYFGGSCAIKRYSKNPRCFACGAGTQGIFNKATKILERKEKAQKERIKQRELAEGTVNYEQDGDGVEIEGLAEE